MDAFMCPNLQTLDVLTKMSKKVMRVFYEQDGAECPVDIRLARTEVERRLCEFL